MTWENLIRALCGAIIAVPGTLALVSGLEMTPGMNAAILVAVLVATSVMSQLPPAGRPKTDPKLSDDVYPGASPDLTPADVTRLKNEADRLKRVQPLRDDLEAKRREGSRG